MALIISIIFIILLMFWQSNVAMYTTGQIQQFYQQSFIIFGWKLTNNWNKYIDKLTCFVFCDSIDENKRNEKD